MAKNLVVVDPRQVGKRRCGDCTGCCQAPTMASPPVKELGRVCPEVCKGKKRGCSIYEDRPQGCRDYSCHWLLNGFLERAHRPDKIGVIFDDGVLRTGKLHQVKELTALSFPSLTAREVWPGAFKLNGGLLKALSGSCVIILVMNADDPTSGMRVIGPSRDVVTAVERALSSTD